MFFPAALSRVSIVPQGKAHQFRPKKRSLMYLLNAAYFALVSAGESAFFVTE